MSTVEPPVPAPAPVPASKLQGILKRAWRGFLAAATTSAAVKEEKNLAVAIVTGVLLSSGATVGLVQLVTSVIQGL